MLKEAQTLPLAETCTAPNCPPTGDKQMFRYLVFYTPIIAAKGEYAQVKNDPMTDVFRAESQRFA